MAEFAFVAVGMVAASQQAPTDVSTLATPDILQREEALIAAMARPYSVRRSPIAPESRRSLGVSQPLGQPEFSEPLLSPQSSGVGRQAPRRRDYRPGTYRSSTYRSSTYRSNTYHFSTYRSNANTAALPMPAAEARLVRAMATPQVSAPANDAYTRPEFSSQTQVPSARLNWTVPRFNPVNYRVPAPPTGAVPQMRPLN